MSKSDAKPSSMKNIRQDISAESLSSKIIALLERSSFSGTQNHYKVFWRKFSGYCQSREINSVSETLNQVLEVLANLSLGSLE